MIFTLREESWPLFAKAVSCKSDQEEESRTITPSPKIGSIIVRGEEERKKREESNRKKKRERWSV
jgi:hypothetical protein